MSVVVYLDHFPPTRRGSPGGRGETGTGRVRDLLPVQSVEPGTTILRDEEQTRIEMSLEGFLVLI